MENITKEDLDKVVACAGTTIREPERSELKAIYDKLEFVCKSLPKDKFIYKIRKDPRNQGGGFKYFQKYLWAKIYPIEFKDNIWDKLAIIIGISEGSMQFHIMGIASYQPYEASLNASKNSWTELDSSDLSYDTIVKEFEKFYKENRTFFRDTMVSLGLLSDSKMESNKQDEFNQQTQTMPLNQIFYGPPGTGKTYHTINKAISIINPSFDLKQSRDLVKAEYKRLVDSGQIVFTTFHQSLSYEDFVEGIKPLIDEDADENKQVIYDVQPGILKQMVDRMLASRTDTSEESSYTFDDGWNDLIELSNEQIEVGKGYKLNILTPKMGMFVTEITSNGNLKLRPSKGSGKEYLVSYARSRKLQQVFPNLSVVKNIDKEFRAVIGGMNSTAYWSVLNFINNKIASKGNKTNKSISSETLPHVLIIDEINRGNVSAIFGELITLIEESKREGKEESLEVTLPYSKEKFIVPENLYIIGTMNTADRSVEAIDTALRRRFVFEEMLPNYQLPEIQQQVFGYSASEILKKINDRIEKLIDRDHCIGHAYFIGKDETTIVESFYKNIIPLLQEYFFGDYGKIGLVLGKGFVEKKTIESNLFADFEYDYKSELEERPVYEIIDYRLNPIDRGTFQEAIGYLMSNG